MTFVTKSLVTTGKPAAPEKPVPTRGRPVKPPEQGLRLAINTMKEPRNTVVRSVEIKGDSDYVKQMIGDVKR